MRSTSAQRTGSILLVAAIALLLATVIGLRSCRQQTPEAVPAPTMPVPCDICDSAAIINEQKPKVEKKRKKNRTGKARPVKQARPSGSPLDVPVPRDRAGE